MGIIIYLIGYIVSYLVIRKVIRRKAKRMKLEIDFTIKDRTRALLLSVTSWLGACVAIGVLISIHIDENGQSKAKW